MDLLATDKSRYFAQPRPITVKYLQSEKHKEAWTTKKGRESGVKGSGSLKFQDPQLQLQGRI